MDSSQISSAAQSMAPLATWQLGPSWWSLWRFPSMGAPHHHLYHPIIIYIYIYLYQIGIFHYKPSILGAIPQFMETHMYTEYTVYAMHTLCILNYLDRWTGWKGIGEQKPGLRIEFWFIQIRKHLNWLKHMSQTNMTCAFHVIPSLHDKMSDWLSSPMGNVFRDTRILYNF